VVVSDPAPEGLLRRLRSAGLTGDAFLLGGRRTLQAIMAAGGIDKLELLKLPVLLGDGVPFSPPGVPDDAPRASTAGGYEAIIGRGAPLRRRRQRHHSAGPEVRCPQAPAGRRRPGAADTP
jgi:dihydrofolate reductase